MQIPCYGLYVESLEVHHQPHVLEGNNSHFMATNKSKWWYRHVDRVDANKICSHIPVMQLFYTSWDLFEFILSE